MIGDTRYLAVATILGISFGVLHLLSTSPVSALSQAVAPYAIVQWFLLAGAAFFFALGWFGSWKLGLVLAALAVGGFVYASTGKVF